MEDGLSYRDAESLLDNYINGLDLEKQENGDIIITTSWSVCFIPDETGYGHLKRYMIENGS